jgi:transposase
VSRSSEDGGSYAAHLEDLDVPDATFGCPDLTTFCRLDELGLVVVGQRLEPDRAVLACRVLEADDGTEGWCRRGRKNDPLYRARRTLHTGADLLTDKQAARLTALFAIDEHVEVEATWGIYQRMIAAYRHPDPAAGRELMVKLIESLSAGVPRPLVEIAKLGRTLSKRAADVLAYFDRPGTSNGPTEAINGRLEHLRGSALGFRNLTNYIARSLLETGGFRPRLHPALVKSRSSWGSAKDTTETGNQ